MIKKILLLTLSISILYYGLYLNNLKEEKFIEVRKFEIIQENYTEITIGELKTYPAIERIISGEGCAKFNENYWRCNIRNEEFNGILTFVGKKANIYSLFKVGENYYKFLFGEP